MICESHGADKIIGAFAYYYPKIHQYYETNLNELYAHHPELTRNFDGSVFPAATINAGPNTVSVVHVDSGNPPGGICALTALGNYDYTKGGHLILYDIKLIIEFPPGATILLPSASFRHGNTPVARGESRFSMAQYCSGGLLRWVACGFRTAANLLKSEGGPEAKRALDGEGDSRWKWAVSLFSKLDELAADHRDVRSDL